MMYDLSGGIVTAVIATMILLLLRGHEKNAFIFEHKFYIGLVVVLGSMVLAIPDFSSWFDSFLGTFGRIALGISFTIASCYAVFQLHVASYSRNVNGWLMKITRKYDLKYPEDDTLMDVSAWIIYLAILLVPALVLGIFGTWVAIVTVIAVVVFNIIAALVADPHTWLEG